MELLLPVSLTSIVIATRIARAFIFFCDISVVCGTWADKDYHGAKPMAPFRMEYAADVSLDQ